MLVALAARLSMIQAHWLLDTIGKRISNYRSSQQKAQWVFGANLFIRLTEGNTRPPPAGTSDATGWFSR
jgi:hypothetical protein